MLIFDLKLFSGVSPRTDKKLLRPEQAQVAENCRLLSGKLESWLSAGNGVILPKAGVLQTVYLYKNLYWFHWNNDVDTVRSPIANNVNTRTYFTGDGVPKMTDDTIALSGGTSYPMNSVILGIPAPTIKPVLAEIQRTNYANTSDDLTGGAETVDLTAGGAGDYTLSVQGTAAVTVAFTGTSVGTGAGQATENNPVTFNLTTANTISLTLDSGTLDANANGAFIKQVEPGLSATLFIESPGSGPTLSNAPSDPNNAESRVYVYTWIRRWNGFDEESAPSDPSAIITVTPGVDAVTITFPVAGPTGNYYPTGSTFLKRIYRTQSGSSGTSYQFVGEIDVATPTFDDILLAEALGESLITTGWDKAPDDMKGLVGMPNGILVGFRENEIIPSVAYQPHAYPQLFRQSVTDNIVGIKVFGQSAVVTTVREPRLLTGVSPESLSLERVELQQACSNKLSMVDMGTYVLYASPDGLVAIGPGIARVVTEDFFKEKEWRALKPSSIRGYYVDGRYVGFYDTGIVQGGFVFDPGTGSASFSFLTDYYDAGYNDTETDRLYLLNDHNLLEWEGGTTPMVKRWKSGVDVENYPTNPAIAQVIGDQDAANPVTFKLWAKYALTPGAAETVNLVYTKTVTDSEPFRVPSDYLATDFEAEVVCANKVDEILAGETAEDLKRG